MIAAAVSVSKYESSIRGISHGAGHLPDFAHGGRIVRIEDSYSDRFQAVCECKNFNAKVRAYYYEANDDLLRHFKKVGTFCENYEQPGRKNTKLWD